MLEGSEELAMSGKTTSTRVSLPNGTIRTTPFPSELMTAYPVSPKMNKASFNQPAAILPLEPTLQLQAL